MEAHNELANFITALLNLFMSLLANLGHPSTFSTIVTKKLTSLCQYELSSLQIVKNLIHTIVLSIK